MMLWCFLSRGFGFFHGSLGENYVFVASVYGNLYETKINYTAVKLGDGQLITKAGSVRSHDKPMGVVPSTFQLVYMKLQYQFKILQTSLGFCEHKQVQQSGSRPSSEEISEDFFLQRFHKDFVVPAWVSHEKKKNLSKTNEIL